jgi:tetratricopeptide (TPR) repeat protein
MNLAFLRVKQGEHDMTSSSVSYISRTLLSILFAVCLVFTPKLVCAQEYTEEEFKAWEDIQAEKEAVKKTDMIVKFLQASPKNPLRPNIVSEFQKVLVSLKNEEKWTQIIALGDKFLSVAPGDDFTEQYLFAAYAKTGNSKGVANLGEKVYASKPSPELAMEIAKAYQRIGNDAKYVQWREKVLASDPNNIEILADMIKRYSANQNLPQAVKYANTCLKALPTAKKPAGMSDQDWQETQNQAYAIAYGVIGADAYQRNNYGLAIRSFESAVKYYKRNEMAYYHLGLCYWQQNKPEPAMLNFAKAYIIKGSVSASAKKYLDQLWKSSHPTTPAGVNRVIERAQQDLK